VDDKDHLSAMLPEPPPPSPARREQAIGTALRRFDGEADVERRPSIATKTSWRAGISRPRLGAAITVALVAMIGLPMALQEIERRDVAYRGEAPIQRNAPSGSSGSPTPLPPSQPSRPAAPAAQKPTMAQAEPPLRQDAEAMEAAPPAAKDDGARDALPEHAPPPPAPAYAKASQADARGGTAMRRAETRSFPGGLAAPAPPPPPPPPPAVVAAPAAPSSVAGGLSEKIVVTSRRRDNGPADNCTVNDARRNLLLCRDVINPAASGPQGQAAAHVAEGLSRAWEGEYDRSIAELDKAIAIAPRLAIAYLNRALVHIRMGETDRAIADADKAVRYAPNAQNFLVRSRIWSQMGEQAKARADQRRAAKIDPAYDPAASDQH
jgi:tetratricopeptide (TPR) repeat protein